MKLNMHLINVLNEITTVLSSPVDAAGVISRVTKLVSDASELNSGLGFISGGGDLQLVTWKNVDDSIATKIQKMNMGGLDYFLPMAAFLPSTITRAIYLFGPV